SCVLSVRRLLRSPSFPSSTLFRSQFSESLQQSAGIVVAHANLVKRVVFPLEALPVSQALASLAGQLFGTVALLLATLVLRRELRSEEHTSELQSQSNLVCRLLLEK